AASRQSARGAGVHRAREVVANHCNFTVIRVPSCASARPRGHSAMPAGRSAPLELVEESLLVVTLAGPAPEEAKLQIGFLVCGIELHDLAKAVQGQLDLTDRAGH